MGRPLPPPDHAELLGGWTSWIGQRRSGETGARRRCQHRVGRHAFEATAGHPCFFRLKTTAATLADPSPRAWALHECSLKTGVPDRVPTWPAALRGSPKQFQPPGDLSRSASWTTGPSTTAGLWESGRPTRAGCGRLSSYY